MPDNPFNRRNDNTAVRQPTDEEVFDIAKALYAHSSNSFESVEDAASYLSFASIAVFPNYATDSVGYVGPVYVVVWGATCATVTTLHRNYWDNPQFKGNKNDAPLEVCAEMID